MLVIGGSSLLGYKLLENVEKFELYATYNKNLIQSKNAEIIKINITNKRDCHKILELKPDIIICFIFKLFTIINICHGRCIDNDVWF